MGKNPGGVEKQPRKPGGQIVQIITSDTKEKKPKGQVSVKKFTTKKTCRNNRKRYAVETGKTSHVDRYKLKSI